MSFRNLAIAICAGLILSMFSSQAGDLSHKIIKHSHNDYEHQNPLFDALSYNFKSIEADVYAVGDSLFVAHDFDEIKPGLTLRKLYLEPLKNELSKNNGSVYGDGEELILFIDIKKDGLKAYKLLDEILQDYKPVLTVTEKGIQKKGGILIVVSGERPIGFMQDQTVRYAGYDGRMSDLDSNIPPTLMPVVSDSWDNYFKWDGNGKMPAAEKLKLKNFANNAKNKGYILRFWGTPNHTTEQRIAVWNELKNAEVGIIGADNLQELKYFLDKQ